MGWIASGTHQRSVDGLMARALTAGSVLEAVGVGPGDGVALYLRNGLAYFEASIATGMLGAYAVPVNWHYTPDEARYLLSDSGATVLLVHADLLPPVVDVIPGTTTLIVVDPPDEIASAYGISPDAIRPPVWSMPPLPLQWRRRMPLQRSSTPRARPREDSGKIFKRKLREPYWADGKGQI